MPVAECSAMKNRGVNEAFTEAARVALSVKTSKDKRAVARSCNDLTPIRYTYTTTFSSSPRSPHHSNTLYIPTLYFAEFLSQELSW